MRCLYVNKSTLVKWILFKNQGQKSVKSRFHFCILNSVSPECVENRFWHSNTFFSYEGREERLEARERQRIWSIVPQNALPAGRCFLHSNITAILSIFCFVISAYQENQKPKTGVTQKQTESAFRVITLNEKSFPVVHCRVRPAMCIFNGLFHMRMHWSVFLFFINSLRMHYCPFPH